MSVRRTALYAGLTFSLTALGFSLGSWSAQVRIERQLADNDFRITELRKDLARSIDSRDERPGAAGTSGRRQPAVVTAGTDTLAAPTNSGQGPLATHTTLVDEVKRQIQNEMGLFPVRLLKERRASFVELNALDNFGKTNYGTAGYLGNGHFITVKHGVIALDADGDSGRRITSIKLRIGGRDVPARVVDSGNASIEVHPGDWAVVKVRGEVDLPALRIDTAYTYDFADPIMRLGNDYSKGIILSSGYVGQRTANGLVTALTDGHPGVSGGGVLNQQGDLIGIPVGRMQGDYRFSFILPVRAEMFRKVPGVGEPSAAAAVTAATE